MYISKFYRNKNTNDENRCLEIFDIADDRINYIRKNVNFHILFNDKEYTLIVCRIGLIFNTLSDCGFCDPIEQMNKLKQMIIRLNDIESKYRI
jgi:hypothetical protein